MQLRIFWRRGVSRWSRSPPGSRVVVVIPRDYLIAVHVFASLRNFRNLSNENSRGQSRRPASGARFHASPVPSLFRLTLISTAKRCEPTRSEIPAQRHDRRSCNQHQKFELYSCSVHEPIIEPHRTAIRASLAEGQAPLDRSRSGMSRRYGGWSLGTACRELGASDVGQARPSAAVVPTALAAARARVA
jgi:hypothetical protein